MKGEEKRVQIQDHGKKEKESRGKSTKKLLNEKIPLMLELLGGLNQLGGNQGRRSKTHFKDEYREGFVVARLKRLTTTTILTRKSSCFRKTVVVYLNRGASSKSCG